MSLSVLEYSQWTAREKAMYDIFDDALKLAQRAKHIAENSHARMCECCKADSCLSYDAESIDLEAKHLEARLIEIERNRL